MTEKNNAADAEKKPGFSFPQSMWGWLLCFVFLTVLTAAVYMSFYPRTEAAVGTVSDKTPGAIPELLISSDVPFDAETLAFLETLGSSVVTAGADSGFSSSGKRCFVCSPDADYTRMTDYFVLTDGRMPQNETECVILPLNGAKERIGDVLCLGNGTYTIVGCAENCRSCFSVYSRIDESLAVREDPITYTDADCILYTVGDALPGSIAFVSGCRDLSAAAKRAEAFASEHWDAYRARMAAATETALAERREKAKVLDDQITALTEDLAGLENTLARTEIGIAQTESRVLDLDRTLQKEIQDFNTEMERQENHSANEVNMIEQKKKAQVRFDAMQTELDDARKKLNGLYDTKEAVLLKIGQTEELLEQKRTEASTALGIDTNGVTADTEVVTAAFRVTGETAEAYGTAALLERAREEGNRFRLPALLLLALTLTAAILTGYFAGRGVTYTVFDGLWLLLCAALVSVLGAAVGGLLLPQIRYPHVLPALAAVTAMPPAIGALTGRLLLLCAVVTLFTCGAAGLGILLRRQKPER